MLSQRRDQLTQLRNSCTAEVIAFFVVEMHAARNRHFWESMKRS